MFTLFNRCSVKDIAFVQAPSFLVALLIAEFFYKFHSFLLESLAFLVTWFVFDAVITWVAAVGRRGAKHPSSFNS